MSRLQTGLIEYVLIKNPRKFPGEPEASILPHKTVVRRYPECHTPDGSQFLEKDSFNPKQVR